MKISIRTRFTVGMVFFFIVIAGISILSAFYMNKLSNKTDAILKENHFSVIFARDMSDALTALNQEINRWHSTDSSPDTVLISDASQKFRKALQLEKNNLSEAGEDKLVSGIESGFNEYLRGINNFNPVQVQFRSLYQLIMLLSKMNEQAVILKVDEAKKSANEGLKLVTILATVCFIITLTFTYNFASYFNARFSKLYNGMREIGSGNYKERLNFEGEDEFYDISLVFNDMAVNLDQTGQDFKQDPVKDFEQEMYLDQTIALKRVLEQMEGIKERAENLISQLEHKE